MRLQDTYSDTGYTGPNILGKKPPLLFCVQLSSPSSWRTRSHCTGGCRLAANHLSIISGSGVRPRGATSFSESDSEERDAPSFMLGSGASGVLDTIDSAFADITGVSVSSEVKARVCKSGGASSVLADSPGISRDETSAVSTSADGNAPPVASGANR